MVVAEAGASTEQRLTIAHRGADLSRRDEWQRI